MLATSRLKVAYAIIYLARSEYAGYCVMDKETLWVSLSSQPSSIFVLARQSRSRSTCQPIPSQWYRRLLQVVICRLKLCWNSILGKDYGTILHNGLRIGC